LHTLLDLRGPIPAFIHITDGKVHDVNVLDLLLPEAGAFYIMDRGYIHLQRLYTLHQAKAFFVIRARHNTQCRRLYSRPVNKAAGLLCDQTVMLTGVTTRNTYPEQLRRIKYRDPDTGNTLVFLTNHFTLPALTIAQLYRCRWQVELFFKWIKQHLRIKAFYGTSENAVRSQIWIAISVYVLVAIIKKRLNIPHPLYTILQILSLTVFERMPLQQVLTDGDYTLHDLDSDKQLNLFN
jgi:transposase